MDCGAKPPGVPAQRQRLDILTPLGPALKTHSICFVAVTAYPVLSLSRDIRFAGGAEVQQSLVATRLAERGHDVSMVCFDHGQPDGEVVRGVRVHKAYAADAGLPGLRFLHPRLTGLWAAMKRADAEAYYQRTRTMEVGIVAAFAKAHGRHSIFAAANDVDFGRGRDTLKYMRDRLMFDWGVRNVDAVVVQTPRQRELCRQRFDRESHLIPSGYGHRGGPAGQDGPILWVATAKTYKRPHLFLDLANRLPQYRFRLVGGPGIGKEERDYYDALCERASKLPNVENCGFVAYADVEERFDGGSIFINTSIGEGFPNTFLQAWTRGMPTVSFFDPEVRYEGSPVAITVDTVDEMVETVHRLKSTPDQWSAASRHVRSYAAATHSIDAVCDAYEALLGGLGGGGMREGFA